MRQGGEQPTTPTNETTLAPGPKPERLRWADHNVLPPEHSGAWLYVADTRTLEEGPVKGAWLPAHIGDHEAAMALGSLTGESVSRWHLSVIDQVGCGAAMLDEDHFVSEHRR